MYAEKFIYNLNKISSYEEETCFIMLTMMSDMFTINFKGELTEITPVVSKTWAKINLAINISLPN